MLQFSIRAIRAAKLQRLYLPKFLWQRKIAGVFAAVDGNQELMLLIFPPNIGADVIVDAQRRKIAVFQEAGLFPKLPQPTEPIHQLLIFITPRMQQRLKGSR